MKIVNISSIIIMFGCIIAEIILFTGGKNMDVAQWVAIAIAIFGVAGGIWTQIVQFKKDAQRIDNVNKTSSEVLKDTTGFKPQIESTYKNVSEMRDKMLRDEASINNALSGVSELVEAKRIEERIKAEASQSVCSPEILTAEIKLLFETNAEIASENAMLKKENKMLQHENKILKLDNEMLHKKQGKQQELSR